MTRLSTFSNSVQNRLCKAPLFLNLLLLLGFLPHWGRASVSLLRFTQPQTLPCDRPKSLTWTVQTRSDGSSMVSLCGRHNKRLEKIGDHGGQTITLVDETVIRYEPNGWLTVQAGRYSVVVWIRGGDYACVAPGATLSGGNVQSRDLLAIIRSADYTYGSCIQTIVNANAQLIRPCACALKERLESLIAHECRGAIVSLVGLREAEAECCSSAWRLPVGEREEFMSTE